MTKKGSVIIDNFDGTNTPEDFEFPSIGIEDIDRAVFKLFDEKLNFQVTQKKESRKVPVVFATGERFALTRRKDPIRDRNNAIILPIISIMRDQIDFGPGQSNLGTAISFREQPSYVIKRRLSKSDRQYQNILNKMGIKNQDNVTNASLTNTDNPDRVSTRRNSGNQSYSSNKEVSLNNNIIGKNIFEIIEVPYPDFIALTYSVVFWTQYMSQANQMMENLISNFEGQGEEITMKTEDGFDLVAYFERKFSVNSNFDSGLSDSERIIKHTINLTVPGYIINPKNSGIPNKLRSYFSAPQIEFGINETSANVIVDNQPERFDESVKRHVLTDLTAIENYGDRNRVLRRAESSEVIQEVVENPFSGETEVVFSKVLSRNKRTGETVISSLIINEIDKQYE